LVESDTSMRAEAGVGAVRKGRKSPVRRDPLALVRRRWKVFVTVAALALLAVIAVAFAYAGSSDVVADGVKVSGVDVRGLDAQEAEAKLTARAHVLSTQPVVFTAGGRKWSIAPAQLAVKGNWAAASRAALERGDGPLPLRGLERLRLRLFGADIEPTAEADEGALGRQLRVIARQVNVRNREAAIVLRNDEPVVVPGEAGRSLNLEEAAATMVAALASLERGGEVALPIEITPPAVDRAALAPVLQQVRTALSAPVTFAYRGVHLSVTPAQMASFLELPHGGSRALGIGGTAAKTYFDSLSRAVWRAPREVDFTVDEKGKAHLVRSRNGRKLDVEA
jgi:Putative peptidoglycan binding domain